MITTKRFVGSNFCQNGEPLVGFQGKTFSMVSDQQHTVSDPTSCWLKFPSPTSHPQFHLLQLATCSYQRTTNLSLSWPSYSITFMIDRCIWFKEWNLLPLAPRILQQVSGDHMLSICRFKEPLVHMELGSRQILWMASQMHAWSHGQIRIVKCTPFFILISP